MSRPGVSRRRFTILLGSAVGAGLLAARPASSARQASRFAPFVPEPGTIANISRNTMASVQPCPKGDCIYSGIERLQGAFAWCGGAALQHVGKWGRLGHWGGGHGAYFGNETYWFDFETGLWQRRKDPAPYGGNAGGPHDRQINEWGEYADGEPSPPHTYRGLFGLGPENGGGEQGSLVQISMAAVGGFSKIFRGSHMFDYTTQAWTRYAKTLSPGNIGYGPVAFDRRHGKFYATMSPQTELADVIQVLDCKTREWTVFKCRTPPTMFHANGTLMDYCPPLHCLVLIRLGLGGASSNNPQVWTVPCDDLQQGWKQRTTNEFSGVLIGGHSMNWASFLGKFVHYNALGQNTVHYLAPPETIGGIWEWSRETFAGVPPDSASNVPGGGYTPTYNRFNPIERLRCFAWYSRANGPVQLWRPRLG